MLIAGCSHAAGSEIDGSEDSQFNRANSFGNVLAEQLGYKPINIAINGSTNSGIARSVIEWYNKSEISSPIIKAAVAHLYFESIHPFEDGNGRIGRAIAEKALSQGFDHPIMFSISKSIEENRSAYYIALQNAQQKLDLTKWIQWFASIIIFAQDDAEKTIQFTVKKVKFFDKYDKNFNERQRKVINRILEEGSNGFKGGMNVKNI